MSTLVVSGAQAQVIHKPAGNLQVSGMHVQALRRLASQDLEVSGLHVQVLIQTETLSVGDPMVSVQRKIPGLGWQSLRPRRLH